MGIEFLSDIITDFLVELELRVKKLQEELYENCEDETEEILQFDKDKVTSDIKLLTEIDISDIFYLLDEIKEYSREYAEDKKELSKCVS